MATVLHPWQILVAAMAGWIARQQDATIEYLREESRVLKQQLGRQRLKLTDDQRRRLAVLGKALGRRALTDIASLVTPDTILRWLCLPKTPSALILSNFRPFATRSVPVLNRPDFTRLLGNSS